MPALQYWPRDLWHSAEPAFDLKPFSLSAVSPYVGSRSVSGPVVQLWSIEFTSTVREPRDWRRMSAILNRSAGMAGLIRIGDPKRIEPYYNKITTPSAEAWSDATLWDDGTGFLSGLIPPTATVGAAQAAESETLLIYGLPASLAPCLYAGDLLEIRPNGQEVATGHLYEVHQDAPTNASGQTRASINPPLRMAVAAGDQISFAYPTSVFRAIDDGQGRIQPRLPEFGQAGFTLIEEVG